MRTNITCRYVLILSLLAAAFRSGPVQAEDAANETERLTAEPAQEDPAGTDSKDGFPVSINDVKRNLVIIECASALGTSSGSGFIATMDGKSYIFTNQHIILGADRIEFKTGTGERLNSFIRGVELSRNRDIARILIDDRADALAICENVLMGESLAVFGNSDGDGDAAAELDGKVTGVGAELVEVSAEFESGNSGSPVINAHREVMGIASYVRNSRPSKMTENTPFEDKTRRFCYRLTGGAWIPVNWKQYNEKYGRTYQETVAMVATVYEVVTGLFEEPFGRVTEDQRDAGLANWTSQHNRAVSGSGTQRRREVGKSTEALSDYCRRKARSLELTLRNRDLTGFLRDELEGYRYSLEYAAEAVDYFNTKLPSL